MADYEDILAIAEQIAPSKKKEDDLTDECQEEFQHEPNEDSKINWIFLKEVPEYMKCNVVCCNIFEEPQLLSCCGRNICKKCIESHIRRVSSLRDQKPSCPYCREEEFQLIKNSALEMSINQLKVRCPYESNGCGWTGALKDGKLHLKECNFFLIDCPNRCGCEKFSRSKLSDHLSKCNHQYISCSFQEVGCEAEMLREEMEGHTNADLHQHLLLIAQSNMQASSECKSTLAGFITNCDSSLKQSIVLDTIASHKTVLESLQSTINKFENELKEEQHSIDSLSHSVDELEAVLSQLKHMQRQAKSSEDLYKATLKEVQTYPIIPPAIANGIGMSCPPITFTIDNFKKRMATNDHWLSPPFYTHVGGYKMCLCVYPNGHSSVRGEYISVSIHFMTGEFDDHLMWPFPGGIFTITAICQRGSKCNRSVHIEMNGKRTRQQRVKQIDGSYGFGLGESKFLTHEDYTLRIFLMNNCFKIMVYRIQFLPL